MPHSHRRLALITGASAGIGTALAREFAGHGYDLVLTARRLDRLEALGAELGARHRITTHSIAADLADPAAPAALFAEIGRRGLKVDALVNNAGYGLPGHYHRTDWNEQAAFLQVLVTSVCHLSHLALPGMMERRFGRILNVASLAGLIPGSAGHTLYGAAKSFVIKFSQSLALEATGHGVHVTALCPGLTYSEFHDVTGTRKRVSQMPEFMWMTAESVARQGYAAVERGQVVCVTGGFNRGIARLAKLVPERVALGLTARGSRRFRTDE
jgi:short-subunit dehydrogenase